MATNTLIDDLHTFYLTIFNDVFICTTHLSRFFNTDQILRTRR